MDNQHQKIAGYRDLSQAEIDAMNAIKACGVAVELVIKELESNDATDKRWIAIGRTNIQQGFMALIRSVAKPTTFV